MVGCVPFSDLAPWKTRILWRPEHQSLLQTLSKFQKRTTIFHIYYLLMHVEEIYKYFHIFLTILGTENMTRPVTYYRDCVWVHGGNSHIFFKTVAGLFNRHHNCSFLQHMSNSCRFLEITLEVILWKLKQIWMERIVNIQIYFF